MRMLSLLEMFAVIAICIPRAAIAADRLDTAEKGFLIMRGGISTDFCQMANIPCGWELAAGDDWLGHGKPTPLNISSGTLRQQLDQFIAGYPGYSWAFQDGVVNFEPAQGHALMKAGALVAELRITTLDIDNLPVIQAGYTICEAAGLKCGRAGHAGIRRHYGKVTLHLKNLTLRQAANALVTTDGISSWMFAFNPIGKDYVLLVDSWRTGPTVLEEKKLREKTK